MFILPRPFVMQLFRFSSVLALIIVVVSLVVSVAADSASTGHHPSSWDELRNALHDLGYDGAEGLQKPQDGSIASQNKGCVKTVSVLACFRHPSRFSLKV